MAEEDKGKGSECIVCHCDSQERPLIPLLSKGENQWVCVGCLPMLIHGAH